MKLKRVTITGADDSIKIQDLLELNERFPFVEFGILVSKRTGGQPSPRFPSADFMKQLGYWQQVVKTPLNLSCHVCGKWVREICRGIWVINGLIDLTPFNRIQLNFHNYLHQIEEKAFLSGLLAMEGKQFIFQLDGVNNAILDVAQDGGVYAVPLFDLSGGAGVLPDSWPKARLPLSGYAGGLSPDNLENQLQKISTVVGEVPIWIDTETHVRSNDDQQFDLEKVRRFLEIAEPWVKG